MKNLITILCLCLFWFSCENSTEPDNTFVPEEFMEGTWNLISVDRWKVIDGVELINYQDFLPPTNYHLFFLSDLDEL